MEENILYLAKFGTKEHLQQLADGHMFFNVVEKYREDKSNYRGDKNEGKIPVNSANLEIRTQDGINLFNGIPRPSNVMLSYEEDEKVLLFCAAKLDEKVFYKVNSNERKLCKEFKKTISNFGEYVLLLTENELIYKMRKRVDHLSSGFLRDSVKYRNSDDFSCEKNFREIYYPYGNEYDGFFVKDNKFLWQNEWRMILQDEKHTISTICGNGVIVDIGKLEYAHLFKTDKFLDSCVLHND